MRTTMRTTMRDTTMRDRPRFSCLPPHQQYCLPYICYQLQTRPSQGRLISLADRTVDGQPTPRPPGPMRRKCYA